MDPAELARFVSDELRARANPKLAAPMQAYMKTTMPFYGVKKPERVPIFRAMHKQFVPTTQREYERGVLALWKLEHREEKYCALEFAGRHKQFVAPPSIALYERLVREGQWWDLVDEVAMHLVSRVLLKYRADVKRELYAWSKDDDMWIRRTSIVMHAHHKLETDEKELFRVCALMAPETVFWIRKAIGWALREYGKVQPDAVRKFIDAHELSGLSVREAKKGIAAGKRR